MFDLVKRLERRGIAYANACNLCYASEGAFCAVPSCRLIKQRLHAVLTSIRQLPLSVQVWLIDTWRAYTRQALVLLPVPSADAAGERRLLQPLEAQARGDAPKLSVREPSANGTARARVARTRLSM